MIEHSCDFDLVNESFLSIFLGVCSFFPERLNRHFLLVFELHSQIYSSEVSLSQPFFCLEEFVKVELIHVLAELDFPFFNLFYVVAVKVLWFCALADELDSEGRTQSFFLPRRFGPEYLEDGLKSDIEAFAILPVFREMVENDLLGHD